MVNDDDKSQKSTSPTKYFDALISETGIRFIFLFEWLSFSFIFPIQVPFALFSSSLSHPHRLFILRLLRYAILYSTLLPFLNPLLLQPRVSYLASFIAIRDASTDTDTDTDN